ncbi:hypothetical protein FSARC_10940 [Fusarium sarcochroum]|uniref:Rhodopsin domain-containing protein n=1 Tax=Fusarium sarcochroum TaxID=1208366 RepID=A0A8H4TJ75_9HYPO|nr:hypothetical protein FSARC_10940 [Fusarium sarcochroum]
MNLNENPHGRLVLIVIWILWFISLSFLALRLFVRHRLTAIWWDDGVLLFAAFVLTTNCITTTLSVSLGFGSWMISLEPTALRNLDLFVRLEAILAGLAITTSKLAFGLTLIRILPAGHWRRLVIALAVSLIIVVIPTFPLAFLQCFPLPTPRNDPEVSHCQTRPVLMYFTTFYSFWQALVDFTFVVVAIKTVSGLKMKMVEKIGLILAMSLGLLSGVMAIVKAYWGIQLMNQIDMREAVQTTITTTAESATAIIATSIPVLRVLYLKGFQLSEKDDDKTTPQESYTTVTKESELESGYSSDDRSTAGL